MTPSDLVALVARLREMAGHVMAGKPKDTANAAAAAIEQLQAELAAALEDASELRALDNEAQHGADAARAELARLRSLEEVAEADSLSRAIAASEANCDAMRAELETVKDDAERYRWLKANHLQTGPDSWIRTGDDLEEAVDVARAPSKDSP